MLRTLSLTLLFAWGGIASVRAAETQVVLTGGKADQKNLVITVPIIGAKLGERYGAFFREEMVPAQITTPSLVSGGNDPVAVFVLPVLKANEELTVKIAPNLNKRLYPSFTWTEPEGKEPILNFDGVKRLAYVRPEFDPKATPAKQQAIANPTIKIYHHLFTQDGKTQLTNGPEGKFPHHRGIFFGFNRITYNGKKADVWHCRDGEHQSHTATVLHEAGSVLGKHRVSVDWFGQDGKVFAKEQRELTLFNTEGGTLIEFNSVVTPEVEKVKLDGDPQHAGFHFRAAQDVEKNPNETYYLRPSGKGQKGKEENWNPKGKAGPVNLPWNAMSPVIGGKRYTIVYLDHPNNPKEARQSERNYGRFGTYFEYEMTKENPLKVQYRLWVQEGEMTGDQCQLLSQAFTNGVSMSRFTK